MSVLLALVVGPVPYWGSIMREHARGADVRTDCARIESRFLRAGWTATITLAGDGSDGRELVPGVRVYDALTRTQWHKETRR